MEEVSYSVPESTTFETVKTFTPGGLIASVACMEYARIGCCLGSARLVLEFDGVPNMTFDLGVDTIHFRSGIHANRNRDPSPFSTQTVRRSLEAVYLEARSRGAAGTTLYCGGASVELKLCLSVTDALIDTNLTCACTGTCPGTVSYVSIL